MPTKPAITSAAVERMKAPAKGQIDYFDKQYPGLVLRVSCGGRKTWNYVYRIRGEQRRMKLDTYPAMSVAEAHHAWRKARDLVQAGRDPAKEGKGQGAADFPTVVEEWLQRDQAKNRSAGVVRRYMERDVLPHWQHKLITEIGRRDCLDVIDALADRGKITAARRLHSHISRLFQWAIGRGIVDLNPLSGVSKPGAAIKRERVLSDSELVKVWRATERVGWPYGPAIQLLALTGARRDEIGKLRWSEIDGDEIKLEGARTKNGEAHNVPLSSAARAVLDQIPRIAESEFVFTTNGRVPVSDWGNAKTNLDDFATLATPWRIHDVRRTVATGLQKLKVPLTVTEAVLGHTAGSRGGVVGIYQRHDYADEKRPALEAWGAYVTALIEGGVRGKVLPTRGKG